MHLDVAGASHHLTSQLSNTRSANISRIFVSVPACECVCVCFIALSLLLFGLLYYFPSTLSLFILSNHIFLFLLVYKVNNNNNNIRWLKSIFFPHISSIDNPHTIWFWGSIYRFKYLFSVVKINIFIINLNVLYMDEIAID